MIMFFKIIITFLFVAAEISGLGKVLRRKEPLIDYFSASCIIIILLICIWN